MLITPAMPIASSTSTRWKRSSSRFSAGLSVATFLRLQKSPVYGAFPTARAYAITLRAELAEIRRTHTETLEFAEDGVPAPVLGMAMQMGRLSKLLPIFDANIRVARRGPCSYVVRTDGSIVRPPEDCRT